MSTHLEAPVAVTRGLVVATLIALGMGGGLLDRALIATPAWDRLGVEAWADYSRYADLGNGLVIYPIVGILPTVLALAAAISHRLQSATDRASTPIYLAALSMIGVMATTVVAAPLMLGVDDLGDDSEALQRAFDDFTLWGVYVRGAFFAMAFLATVWALCSIARPTRALSPTTVPRQH